MGKGGLPVSPRVLDEWHATAIHQTWWLLLLHYTLTLNNPTLARDSLLLTTAALLRYAPLECFCNINECEVQTLVASMVMA